MGHVCHPAKPGADAAGLAFDALTAAREAGTQVLLVDTAGRLHNKTALMEELRKIVRVMRRVEEVSAKLQKERAASPLLFTK